MAYIAQRGVYGRAEIRRKGYKPTYRTFDTKLQAQQRARQVESSMDAGIYTDRSPGTLISIFGRSARRAAATAAWPFHSDLFPNRDAIAKLSRRHLPHACEACPQAYKVFFMAGGSP